MVWRGRCPIFDRSGNPAISVRNVVLDLDGPILDGRVRHYTCYRSILEEHGLVPLPIDVYWTMKRERVDRRRQLAASDGAHLYELFLSAWLERIEQPSFLALDELQAGALETIRGWKNQGRRLILATQRHNHEGLMLQLSERGVDAYLDYVLPCAHARGGAGKAEYVREAVPGLTASETIWIGDTEVDIEAARALGCRVCAVTCGLRTEAYLSSLSPDYIVQSLAEVKLSVTPISEA